LKGWRRRLNGEEELVPPVAPTAVRA